MAAVKLDTRAQISVDEVPDSRHYGLDSSPDRQRRVDPPISPQRVVSRGKTSNSRSSGFRSPSPDGGDTSLPPDLAHRYPSHQSSASASASGTATAGSSSSRGGAGEDHLTLRRREANRLAAQRFRSRKKGYQDSLEERIRALEEEKDSMVRRLDPGHRHSPEYSRHEPYRRRSVSPDRHADGDVRVASLESANRRLQDELRGALEENERLRDEVDRWRRWERDLRDHRPPEERYARSAPTLPPLELKAMAPPSYPPSSPYDSSHPTFPPRHPPLERGQSWTGALPRRPPSPGLRLPPLRLPHDGSIPSAGISRPLLPRPESMERLNHGGV